MSQIPAAPHALIADPEALSRTIESWAHSPFLALDTEFIRVDTYYPKLCLVQVRGQREAALIDAVNLPALDSLLDALYAPDKVKLFHAAGQDLEILVRLRGAVPQPIFDTQIAATLLGYGDQLGYAGLIERRLGVVLDKSLSRTDWSRRPLRPAELAYAAADVEHLAEIYPALQDELVARGRIAWLAEDCVRLCDPAQYRTEPADAWRRLRGLSRLSPREQTIAAAIAHWREEEAQRRDRPRKWIVDDDAVYRLAQRQPQTRTALESLAVLPPKTLERHGESLLALIDSGLKAPEQRYAMDDEFGDADKRLLKALQAHVAARAAALELPASYLAPRADLAKLVRDRGDADVNVLRGWRREVCGSGLLELLP
ncbi:MAG: ribonuclease D [Pseudomonadota bacterium]|uniref:ribonuclease D n=1 Tax=Sinimarinibacterium flocculans TaxID=985250 RepID=UPI002E989B6F|nr:ribonuclease D [Pseudomonadota bacterium]